MDTFLVLLFSIGVVAVLVTAYSEQLRHSKGVLYGAFAFHLLMFTVYYLYTANNASDSFAYYNTASTMRYGEDWGNYYGVSTYFINFLSFPLVQYLGFSYEGVMLLFSLFGFIGIFYFYLFVTEGIVHRHRLFGIDFIMLLLFLPNMHFWSVSLGKGSVVLMGMGMLFYALNNIGRRVVVLLLGGLIVFHVRSHVLLVILASSVVASIFSSKGIKGWQKLIIVAVSLAAISPVLSTFLDYAGLEEADSQEIASWQSHRTNDLSNATSGVDLENYSQPMKIFTFLFRPLFIDSPNAMGLIVSVENLFYLIFFLKCLSPTFFRYFPRSPWIVKVSFIAFLGVSIALAQISANTGIAIRQKSQVMYLFLFVFLAYADYAYQKEKKLVIGE
ncbi:hypothetical protein GGR26_002452 [Lewinella marina]|uniref:Uncharacterized protein n=1 Tax=Neolewinella marina TaxID=438751 RepID=A0A2G0CBX8_9BACT|nr:hypothetical protein [Neolewinella marina]NJB86675.1 hypothetical protein [Neolewinella marina]PHK97483.1 hypothetical protein CGL56_15400 [Neolewinella marina]